jgi:hypothetical protein
MEKKPNCRSLNDLLTTFMEIKENGNDIPKKCLKCYGAIVENGQVWCAVSLLKLPEGIYHLNIF